MSEVYGMARPGNSYRPVGWPGEGYFAIQYTIASPGKSCKADVMEELRCLRFMAWQGPAIAIGL